MGLHEKHVRYQKHQAQGAEVKEMDYSASPRTSKDKAQPGIMEQAQA